MEEQAVTVASPGFPDLLDAFAGLLALGAGKGDALRGRCDPELLRALARGGRLGEWRDLRARVAPHLDTPLLSFASYVTPTPEETPAPRPKGKGRRR